MRTPATAFRSLVVTGAIGAFAIVAAAGVPHPKAGWTADLSTVAHNVSGTARIVDADTYIVEDFNYDGRGISVYFYLASDAADFANGIETGPQLLGPVYEDSTMIVNLPAGQNFDTYGAISVWCVVAGVSFGDGVFMPPPCVADYDPNGIVDIADVLVFLNDWFMGVADLTGDGTTDIQDLLTFMSAWLSGEGCP